MHFKVRANRTDWWTGSQVWGSANSQDFSLCNCGIEFVQGLEAYDSGKSVQIYEESL